VNDEHVNDYWKHEMAWLKHERDIEIDRELKSLRQWHQDIARDKELRKAVEQAKPADIEPPSEVFDKLTAKQRRCVQMICNGMSASDIARETGVSVSGVTNHLRLAQKRIGVENRAALIRATMPPTKALKPRGSWSINGHERQFQNGFA